MVRTTRIALLLSSLLLSIGCAAEPEAEEADTPASSEEAVIGGTETFAHPEIGVVFHASSFCTGTLVRPNVVLTAAHCVSGRPKDEAQDGYSFVIKRSATEKLTYQADRVFALPEASDFDGSQHWRAKDIALLRLTTDVPADVARPLAIGHYQPIWLSKVAIYGYGCTSRVRGADGHMPGGGIKRTKEYTWSLGLVFHWADTQNVCPGDSGGPLLDVWRGAVVGTTSGWMNDNDIFGDVPANHAAVETIVARWWPRR